MKIQSISKAYGSKQVLTDFSCTIPDHSVCAVMAPSGKGKTTLLRLLLGLEQPDSGRITGIPDKKAVLFQEDRLCMNLTAEANIRMVVGRKSSREEITVLLHRLGLEDIQKPVSALSGGMRRRAALARALLYDSGILILDEPFTGLDDENRHRAAQTILEYRKGRTLIFVTHQKEDLELLGTEQVITL